MNAQPRLGEPTSCPVCGGLALVRVALGFVCTSCGWGKELLNKPKRKAIKR